MPQQQSPFLEGKYGWNYGESGWNTGMDENLLKFSFMFDRNVDGIVSSLPAAVNGQSYFLTADNRLYFAVGAIWYSSPTPRWFEFKIRSTGDVYQFNGTTAVQIDSAATLDSRLDAIELTLSTLGNAATRTALGTTGELYSRDSILGTVSQSAGIPTGAIIERGSNANGEYVRYADGTQICTNKVIINRVTPPNGRQNNLLNPAASFVGDPTIYKLLEFYNNTNGIGPYLYTFSTTLGRFVNSGQPGTTDFSWPPQIGGFTANSEIQTLIAIGRWY